jgi:hypothetical protein
MDFQSFVAANGLNAIQRMVPFKGYASFAVWDNVGRGWATAGLQPSGELNNAINCLG